MKTQPLIFSFAFTLLGFFSGFSVVFADGFQPRLNNYLEKDKIEQRRVHKLVTSLAEQGDAKSHLKMALMYKNGQGVQQDYEEAVKWYQLAAEQGDSDAQYMLGLMYKNGQGVQQDYEEAVKWYQLAAEQGSIHAQYNLGLMYSTGKGTPQSHKESFKWLLKVAEQKFLVVLRMKAQRLIRANYHQLHKQIAEEGDSYAQRFLGASYYLGLGVTQDYAEAAKWYKKAAEKEDRIAQNILGAMYAKGKGVSKDFVEAYKWFSISGKTGNGRMYKEKIGKQKMTSAQIAKAQKLVRKWTEKYPKK
jgi:TPR repeat protein